jgi:hypothetical protein
MASIFKSTMGKRCIHIYAASEKHNSHFFTPQELDLKLLSTDANIWMDWMQSSKKTIQVLRKTEV